MQNERRGLKRFIGGIYSFAADRIYDPVVVKGAFRLFGGDLNEHVLDQGRRAAAVAKDRPILDMPVGTGYFTIDLARRYDGLVVGSDIAEGMVRAARRTAVRSGVGNLWGAQADAHHLPFRDGAFGAVLCNNGLQVIPGLRPTVKELVRVLAPGGRLFVSVVAAPVGGLLPRNARDHIPTMLRPRRDLVDVLTRAGLINIEMQFERLAALYEATKPK